MTRRFENILLSCNGKMFRYMAGVIWTNYVSSLEMARRCGVEEFDAVLRRLTWFGMW